jgi:LysM repeat protein
VSGVQEAPQAPLAVRPAPLRLTRRGRVVLAGFAALVIGGISMVAASTAQASSHAGPAGRAAIVRVTVRPGQSLWTIAESNDPQADTRVVIGEIQQLNSMSGYVVTPGQVLWVPRGLTRAPGA